MPDRWSQLIETMAIRRAERNQRVLDSQKDLISDGAFLCWAKDDLRFFLCESPSWNSGRKLLEEGNPELAHAASLLMSGGRYNGYVRFPKLPVVAPGTDGIITYVPVHGGITFCQEWWDGSVTYGFDTAHAWSSEIPEIVNDIGWMMQETEALARGIQIAARFEPYYLNARTQERKLAVLNHMNRFLPITVVGNMGVMLAMMGGEL